MDDGKLTQPTGSKARWWSRPGAAGGAPSRPETGDTAADAADAAGDAAGPTPSPAAAPVASQTPATPPTPGPDGPPAEAQAAAAAPAGHSARPQPLHEPDEYRTPPYGEPGPWAPAPPVQRPTAGAPGATPAHGTPAPGTPAQGTPASGPPAPGTPAHGTPAPTGPAPAPAPPGTPPQGTPMPPEPQGGPQHPSQPSPQWLQYDPWSAPGQQPPAQHGPAGGHPGHPGHHLGHPGHLLPSGQPPQPARKGRRRGTLALAALLIAVVAGGVGGGIGAYIERNGGITRVELPQAGRDNGVRPADSVAGIAASALPSVVTLHVSGGGEAGTGTGFVLDRKGHILTNNHVVDPAGETGDISVTFSSGDTARATLVGKDSGYDLAVVRVAGVSNLKPLPLGNSDNVQVGDPVVAIGAPFDLQNTVTAGIISAKERPITAGGEKGDGSDISYVDALQTDAPINPGNSGGPLVDSKAQVIGINSAIRAAGDGPGTDGGQPGSIGLGFAIPINQGKRVAEELINTGKATHPVIGVSLDMKFTGDGARVGEKGRDGGPSVTPGGPAAKAGIRPGDVITKVDGQRVHSGEELIVKIRAHRPGDELQLTLRRGGSGERTLTLILGSSGS
ncbi:S1C family serine protease [Streptomyces sp. PR69]|uniref:S1C family serine protease n=1 Tax=Streptomyces sp. PR69 TaxID=2984950 RepID=UPI002263D140|nr:trypsin-like peptidase domain-containing protein [Streptomyces sp. PR69]